MPSPVDPLTPLDADLKARINRETGRIQWTGLQGHFARGAVLRVDPALDLVAVAAAFHRDDRGQVEAWTQAGQLGQA